MHIFAAALNQETNTFSQMPTSYEKFSESLLKRNGQRDEHIPYYQAPLLVFEKSAKEGGFKYTESLCAAAWPCGVVVRTVYESFRDEILNDLKNALPIDMVLLNLHGAMVADGYDDCEGDLLEHVRDIIGKDVALGIELDPHTHLTKKMIENCDIIIPMKEYPHSDFNEIAEQVFKLTHLTAIKKITPKMSVFDCKILNMYPTTVEPMKGFVQKLRELEKSERVLSASVIHGFPWGDVPDVGTKIIVITDNDKEQGDIYAKKLGLELFDLREQIMPPQFTIDDAIDIAVNSKDKPVVLADFSDNPGGGAFGDSTFILKRLIERKVKNAALSPLWDPISTNIAISAGVGATLDLRIGGKMGTASGDPLDLKVTVRHIEKDFVANFCGQQVDYGDCVALSCDGVDIVLSTISMQTFDTKCFTAFGIDISKKQILVVKSSAHFRAVFEKIAAQIITVSTPGSLCLEFDKLPYKKINRDMWPITNDVRPEKFI